MQVVNLPHSLVLEYLPAPPILEGRKKNSREFVYFKILEVLAVSETSCRMFAASAVGRQWMVSKQADIDIIEK